MTATATRLTDTDLAFVATCGAILFQFLVEAVVLCLVGGTIGVLVGAGGAMALAHFFKWNTLISPFSIGLAFAFSFIIGIFFGLWPARRAAMMDPIVALRYE